MRDSSITEFIVFKLCLLVASIIFTLPIFVLFGKYLGIIPQVGLSLVGLLVFIFAITVYLQKILNKRHCKLGGDLTFSILVFLLGVIMMSLLLLIEGFFHLWGDSEAFNALEVFIVVCGIIVILIFFPVGLLCFKDKKYNNATIKMSNIMKTATKILIFIIALIIFILTILWWLVYDLSHEGYKFKYINGESCIQITDPLSVSQFQEKYKYIEAEWKDVQQMLANEEITNLQYAKKTDKLWAKMPREFIRIPGITIDVIYEDSNKYRGWASSGLPFESCYKSPLETGSSECTWVYIDIDDFPNLEKEYIVGDNLSVLVTNLDSSSENNFYYEVVAIYKEDINAEYVPDNSYLNHQYCY